jgi:uracil phosphoribosyltransferase
MDKSPRVIVLEQSNQIIFINTKMRDRDISRAEFIFHADRLTRLVIEEALNYLPMRQKDIVAPTGAIYCGLEPAKKIFCASIVRSGDAMVAGLRAVCPGIRIEKILIQRNEETREPKLIWIKKPENIQDRICLLMDPMLATGGSACMAIEQLLQDGLTQSSIIFTCLVAAPEGIARLRDTYPEVRIVVAGIDDCLNLNGYILPGLGDFGDRYFGTTK